MSHIVCAGCGRSLTKALIPGDEAQYDAEAQDKAASVAPGYLIRLADEDSVPVTTADGSLVRRHVYSPAGALAIHPDDTLGGLRSTGHDVGCCGSSGSDGPNRACACGHVVATEWSDCWTQAEIRFLPDAVKLAD